MLPYFLIYQNKKGNTDLSGNSLSCSQSFNFKDIWSSFHIQNLTEKALKQIIIWPMIIRIHIVNFRHQRTLKVKEKQKKVKRFYPFFLLLFVLSWFKQTWFHFFIFFIKTALLLINLPISNKNTYKSPTLIISHNIYFLFLSATTTLCTRSLFRINPPLICKSFLKKTLLIYLAHHIIILSDELLHSIHKLPLVLNFDCCPHNAPRFLHS